MPAILIGIIDFDHFILLYVTFTLARGHYISIKENLLASYSYTLFNLMKFGMVVKEFELNFRCNQGGKLGFFSTSIKKLTLAYIRLLTNQFNSNLV